MIRVEFILLDKGQHPPKNRQQAIDSAERDGRNEEAFLKYN